MRIVLAAAFMATLTLTESSKLHRVSLARVNRREPADVHYDIQETLARFQPIDIPQPRMNQKQRTEFIATARRPKAIDAGRVPLQPSMAQTAFVGEIGIGTPPQYFNLQFDIGSSDTWIVASKANCSKPDICPSKRRVFHANRSSTFEQNPNVAWNLEFSDGSHVSGDLHSDVVQVAHFVVDRQVIGIANNLSHIKDNGIDGSLGLGLKELSAHGDSTPIENLIQDKAMTGTEIGIWLGSGNQGGELIFGGKDPDRFTGPLSYFDIPSGSVYWSLPVKSLGVVSKGTQEQTVTAKADAKGTGGPMVILDTSSNLILLPPRVAFQAHQLLNNFLFGWYSGYSYLTGAYTLPCDLARRQTDLWFELGPLAESLSAADMGTRNMTRFKISGQDVVGDRVAVIGGLFNLCYSGIQASKSDEDDWVFGNVWFLNNYHTLDYTHRRVGLAPAIRPETLPP